MSEIVITGARSGLGLEFVRRYAADAANTVHAIVRKPDEAHDLQALVAASGGRIIVYKADVGNAQALKKIDESIVARGVNIDLLINNAGVGAFETLETADAAMFDKVFHANALGPLLVTQQLHMRLHAGSRVINISSILGSIASADGQTGLIYRMSKAALNMLTKQLSEFFRPDGITVISLHPGWVRTGLGGEEAPLETETSVDGMIKVITGLTIAKTGSFLDYRGHELPW